MLFFDSLCDLGFDLLLSFLAVVYLELSFSLAVLLRFYTLILLFGHFLRDLSFPHGLNRPVINGIELHFLQVTHDQDRTQFLLLL